MEFGIFYPNFDGDIFAWSSGRRSRFRPIRDGHHQSGRIENDDRLHAAWPIRRQVHQSGRISHDCVLDAGDPAVDSAGHAASALNQTLLQYAIPSPVTWERTGAMPRASMMEIGSRSAPKPRSSGNLNWRARGKRVWTRSTRSRTYFGL